MSLVTKTCIEAVCDRCGDGWKDADSISHFSPEQDVPTILVDDYDWEAEDGQLFCPNCAVERVYEEFGHERDGRQ